MFCEASTLRTNNLKSADKGESGVTHKDNLLANISGLKLNQAWQPCHGLATTPEDEHATCI